MKYVQAFVLALVGGLVLTLATGAYAQSTTTQGHITVLRIQGNNAQYSLGDGAWHDLVIGQTLGAGAAIRTGADSLVDITLSDKIAPQNIPTPGQMNSLPVGLGLTLAPFKATAQQDVIRLAADTVLSIDKLLTSNTGVDVVNDTELNLQSGQIFGNVKKVSAASVFLVKTPTGIAGVRGTAFSIGANGVLTVYQGSVVVSAVVTLPNGTTTTVAEVVGPGEQFNPANVVVSPNGGVTTGISTLTPRQEIAILFSAFRTGTLELTPATVTVSYTGDQTTTHLSPTGSGSITL
jgi:hypothetical protein